MNTLHRHNDAGQAKGGGEIDSSLLNIEEIALEFFPPNVDSAGQREDGSDIVVDFSESQREEFMEILREYTSEISRLKEEVKKKDHGIQGREHTIIDMGGEIDELRASLKDLQESLKQKDEEIEDLRTAYENLSKKAGELLYENEEMKDWYSLEEIKNGMMFAIDFDKITLVLNNLKALKEGKV